MQLPAAAPSDLRSASYDLRVPLPTGCASARGRVLKTQLTRGGTEAACQFRAAMVEAPSCPAFGFRHSFGFRISGFGFSHWGRGRQVMHLPCKQAHMGAVPIDSTISLRGE